MEAAGIEQAFLCSLGAPGRSRGSATRTTRPRRSSSGRARRRCARSTSPSPTRASSSRSTSPPSRRTGTSSPPSPPWRTTGGSRWSASRRSTTRLRGIPRELIRFHCCWGSWHGPHTTDIAMSDLVDMLVQIDAGSYSFEAANARHEHEWRVWQETKIPDDVVLVPGVVGHATNVIEHPQLVADRIGRFVDAVGARARHRGDRLRPGRPRAPGDRLGEARGPRPGRRARLGALACPRPWPGG